MRQHIVRRVLVVALPLALLGACATPPPVRFTVLHTNDHHGRFWKDADGEYGLAARKTLIDRIRSEVRDAGGYTLLLDGGDVNTGVPESDFHAAEPDFRGMSALGYDAMAVGNHEFDTTRTTLRRQQQEWSSFPWLSANIYERGQRMFEPYRVFALGPVKIAVMGLTTDDTPKMLGTERYPGISFIPPAVEAAKLVPELRKQADVVIAATHMGHYVDGRHGYNAPGDVELARTVPGIDLIVGGHSHSPVCMKRENVRVEAYEPGTPCRPDRQNGTWIVQAQEWGKYVGRADFEYAAGRLTLVRYALLPVNLRRPPSAPPTAGLRPTYDQELVEDAQVLGLLRPFQERAGAEFSLPVGRIDGKLDGDRADVRYRPTNLGRLLAIAMMHEGKADFSLVNSGSIRDSLPAGTITYRDILKVLPFASQLVVVTMTGAEVREYLRAAMRATPGSGAFAQTAGVAVTLREGGEPFIRIGGRPLEDAARYRMAINSFMAHGGDGYPVLAAHSGLENTGLADSELLRRFIAQRALVRIAEFEPDGAGLPR